MKNILSALLVLIPFHTSAHAADKVRIAVPEPNAAYLTFPLAQKKGFFKDEGIAAEVILMRPNVQVPALHNGDIDYITAIPHGVRTTIAGFPVKVIACFLPASTLTLVSRPEIKSVKELKGKTISVGSFGGANYTVGRLMAKHFGLDPEKEVKFLAVGGNEARLAGLKQGIVAATVVPPPWDFHAKRLGFHVIARSYELFSYPQVGLVTNDKKIKEQGDETKRVIRAGIKANRYIRSDREGTVQFLMEWMRIDREVAEATYEAFSHAFSSDGNLPEDGMRIVIDEAKKAANVNRVVTLSGVADLSILREAQRELGIVAR